jgi:hypothetical protein
MTATNSCRQCALPTVRFCLLKVVVCVTGSARNSEEKRQKRKKPDASFSEGIAAHWQTVCVHSPILRHRPQDGCRVGVQLALGFL